MDEAEWKEFEAAVKLLKKGNKSILLRDVIFAATGRRVLPFTPPTLSIVSTIDEWLRNNLSTLSCWVQGSYQGRPNELGNAVENWLRPRLNDIAGLTSERPVTEGGLHQATGYPDGLILAGDNVLYFDVKIYQVTAKDTTLRSFYYQPTNRNKILHDAQHFIIGFEARSLGGNNQSPFQIRNYDILDMYETQLKFKAEFNGNNREIYSQRSLRSP